MLLTLYTCLLWLSTSGLCTIQAEDPSAAESERTVHRGLAPTNVDFALSLYRHLIAAETDKNVFISPVGISMALAMLSLGASGHTQAQLLQSMGFNLTEISEDEIHQSFQHLDNLLRESDTSLEMTMGSTLFLNHSLEPQESFLADIKRYYGSEAFRANFQDSVRANKQIKEYIQNKTQGKIEDMLSVLDGPAMLTVVSYVFFKGTWAHHFDPKKTVEKNFYVDEKTTVKVPMMFQSGAIKYLQDSVLPCQVVQLDYKGNGTVFFILPDQGKMDMVIAALSRDTIGRLASSLTSRQMDLYVPKISLSGTYDLSDMLTDMGMKELFTSQADLSGITKDGQVKVSKVVHKAVLKLNEKGVKKDAAPVVPANEKGVKKDAAPVVPANEKGVKKDAAPVVPANEKGVKKDAAPVVPANEKGVKKDAAPLVPPEQVSKALTLSFNQPFLILIFDNFTWSSLFLAKVVNPA